MPTWLTSLHQHVNIAKAGGPSYITPIPLRYALGDCGHCSCQATLVCILQTGIARYTGRIQILVLTNCQAISTEIGTDSLKI